MSTKIEWVTSPDGVKGNTWNPVSGCTKISPGCQNCYAERMAKRLQAMGMPGYEFGFSVVMHNYRLREPAFWKKPRRVFVCSMGDLFHKDVPDSFIEEVFAVMETMGRRHSYMLLTKRPERMKEFIGHPTGKHLTSYNVMLGVTAENQEQADKRIPVLLQIPAAVRFVSIEPMLGPVDLKPYIYTHRCGDCDWRGYEDELCEDEKGPYPDAEGDVNICPECGSNNTGKRFDFLWGEPCVDAEKRCFNGAPSALDWVIAGCESGPVRRFASSDWFRSLRDQCQAASVPFFLKQMSIDGRLVKMPKLDGKVYNQTPEVSP